jgi:hypothetical protein
MLKRVVLVAALIAAWPALAQDIVGIEDCAKARDPDKKAGCLQSNVNFLHELIKKNEAAAQARQREAAARLTAAAARIEELRGEVERLKATLDQLAKKAPAR